MRNKKVVTRVVTKGGKAKDLGDRYFRSAWERNYARYLNFLVKQGGIRGWRYESVTFEFPVKRGSRFYTPDFEVTELNGSISFHEVKGHMSPGSATKLKRMAKYYPYVRIFVIGKKEYEAVKKWAKLIKNWE